jgi:hypothetical protein
MVRSSRVLRKHRQNLLSKYRLRENESGISYFSVERGFGFDVCENGIRTNHRQRRLTERTDMPERETIERAREDKAEGKAPSTQAGEFIREEMHHIREGKHGARSAKQAIAIGLSKARRAGVKLRAPRRGTVSAKTRRSAARDARAGHNGHRKTSTVRSRATMRALRREGHGAASHRALSRQAHTAANRRSARSRSASARRAAATRRQERN